MDVKIWNSRVSAHIFNGLKLFDFLARGERLKSPHSSPAEEG